MNKQTEWLWKLIHKDDITSSEILEDLKELMNGCTVAAGAIHLNLFDEAITKYFDTYFLNYKRSASDVHDDAMLTFFLEEIQWSQLTEKFVNRYQGE